MFKKNKLRSKNKTHHDEMFMISRESQTTADSRMILEPAMRRGV